MASYLQRIIIGWYLIFCLGCAGLVSKAITTIKPEVKTVLNNNGLSCESPEGYGYECYSREECLAFLNAYGAVLKERFDAQEFGWFLDGDPDVQVVDVNLWDDHTQIYIVGRHTGTRVGNKVWLQSEVITCDVELKQITPYAKMEGWAEWTVWSPEGGK